MQEVHSLLPPILVDNLSDRSPLCSPRRRTASAKYSNMPTTWKTVNTDTLPPLLIPGDGLRMGEPGDSRIDTPRLSPLPPLHVPLPDIASADMLGAERAIDRSPLISPPPGPPPSRKRHSSIFSRAHKSCGTPPTRKCSSVKLCAHGGEYDDIPVDLEPLERVLEANAQMASHSASMRSSSSAEQFCERLKRTDERLRVDFRWNSLSRHSWWHGEMNARDASALLRSTPKGTFLLRRSPSSGAVCASYTLADGLVQHTRFTLSPYGTLVEISPGGREWPDIHALVKHLSDTLGMSSLTREDSTKATPPKKADSSSELVVSPTYIPPRTNHPPSPLLSARRRPPPSISFSERLVHTLPSPHPTMTNSYPTELHSTQSAQDEYRHEAYHDPKRPLSLTQKQVQLLRLRQFRRSAIVRQKGTTPPRGDATQPIHASFTPLPPDPSLSRALPTLVDVRLPSSALLVDLYGSVISTEGSFDPPLDWPLPGPPGDAQFCSSASSTSPPSGGAVSLAETCTSASKQDHTEATGFPTNIPPADVVARRLNELGISVNHPQGLNGCSKEDLTGIIHQLVEEVIAKV